MQFASVLVKAAFLISTNAPLIQDCEFPDAYAFTTATCELHVRNDASSSVHLHIKPVVDGDSVNPNEFDLEPGETKEVQVVVDLGNSAGEVAHFFRVFDGKSEIPVAAVKALGFVKSALDDVRPSVDLGDIDVTSSTDPKILRVDSRESPDLRLSSILELPQGVRASILPDGKSLSIGLDQTAAWGMLDDYVKISTVSSPQRQVWIKVTASAHGSVSPPSNPISMGVLAWTASRELVIPLKARDGRPFKIGHLSLSGNLTGSVTKVRCRPSVEGCNAVKLVLSKRQPTGLFRGAVNIELPESRKSLAVSVFGLLRPPASPSDKTPPAPPIAPTKVDEVHSQNPNPPQGVGLAANSAIAAPGRGPVLKWRVSDDGGVHAYQVYRGSSAAGPFVLLNSKASLAKATDAGGTSYAWRDDSAIPGNEYWYYIGIVYKDGHKQQLTGPQRSVAK